MKLVYKAENSVIRIGEKKGYGKNTNHRQNTFVKIQNLIKLAGIEINHRVGIYEKFWQDSNGFFSTYDRKCMFPTRNTQCEELEGK
jgi:hypothetical protein